MRTLAADLNAVSRAGAGIVVMTSGRIAFYHAVITGTVGDCTADTATIALVGVAIAFGIATALSVLAFDLYGFQTTAAILVKATGRGFASNFCHTNRPFVFPYIQKKPRVSVQKAPIRGFTISMSRFF